LRIRIEFIQVTSKISLQSAVESRQMLSTFD
jgi:hypothetical protein